MRPSEHIHVRSSGPHPDRHPCLRRSRQGHHPPDLHLRTNVVCLMYLKVGILVFMRRISSNRGLLALLVLTVLLSPLRMVFACQMMEEMQGKVQYTCCCDEPCIMGAAVERDTARGDQSSLGFEGCCDVSYLDAPDASTRGSQSLVVMLDASQPPPIPVSFEFQNFASTSHVILSSSGTSPPLRAAPVYLLTNRFRI